jgi:NAD(P)-dependent dehydrogenase (short-subunit alcohol dehydrogenase family)
LFRILGGCILHFAFCIQAVHFFSNLLVDLTDRVALITGGKRIGARVATELARRGADVALTFHSSQAAAEESAGAVRALGRRAHTIWADLRDPAGCVRAVNETAETFGRLDILVNMASTYRSKPFDQLTEEDWYQQLRVDLDATWFCSRAAVLHMRPHGGGRIVNFSDWVAKSGRPRYHGFAPYYVAKAGVIAITEALALELAADRILVNAVAPGPIVAPEGTTEEEIEQIERSTPLGRWGGEIEIAKVVLALIDTDFITGETVRVDGGRHLK